jgi:hypothetical protein
MTKKLYTRIKIPFDNPYVVRLSHDGATSLESTRSHQKIISRARKLIQGTWGYCSPEYEMVEIGKEQTSISYWCFQDELDALQFRLMADEKAIRVSMWPENRLFTIFEVVEDE